MWRKKEKKVFSQPPTVQVLPLKKMREACNFVIFEVVPMMKFTGLKNWWLTKYFFAPLYICIRVLPFKSLGSHRNVLVFERKAHFFVH